MAAVTTLLLKIIIIIITTWHWFLKLAIKQQHIDVPVNNVLPAYQQEVKSCCLETKKSVRKHLVLCHRGRSLNSISYVSFFGGLVGGGVACALISSLKCALGKNIWTTSNIWAVHCCTHCLWWWHVPVWILTGRLPGEGSGAAISPFMISDELPCDPHFINMLSRKRSLLARDAPAAAL